MNKEWYLLEYERKTYLHNKVLSPRVFPCLDEMHDHCELCWARFSKHLDDLQNGYFEPTSKSWICPECYINYASLFGWTVE